MIRIKSKRIRQIITYGWKDAKEIASMENVRKGRISIYFDILSCFQSYYLFSNQYKAERLWELTESERNSKAIELGKLNHQKDDWVDRYYSDWSFLNKYTSFKWQKNPDLLSEREKAYKKHYGYKGNATIQYGVTIICEHFSIGKITIGENVLLARGCDIDYTGDIEIGDNVGILEGAKVLTHAHDSYHFMQDSELIPFSNRAFKTNLKIGNNVSICARAIILPGVREIGENSIVVAGSVVNRPVPPNVIVEGNPAKVVRKIPVGAIKKTH